MSSLPLLLERNKAFAKDFKAAGMPPLPALRTVIIACVDPRTDPAYVMQLEHGESVVIRNNGGRVTEEVIDEIGALTFLVEQVVGGVPPKFEVIVMQHTKCGAQRMADPQFQAGVKAARGVDVSAHAYTDHIETLTADVERLRASSKVPGYVLASAVLYDVNDGLIKTIIEPHQLEAK